MSAQPPLLPLRLSSAELWILHHVLLDRIELEQRSPATVDPPPLEVFQAFDKLEAGEHLFTPTELRRMRSELRRYLERTNGTGPDRVTARRVIDRITDTLAVPLSPGLSPDRRPPPR